jgi:hypothetical protein
MKVMRLFESAADREEAGFFERAAEELETDRQAA